MSDVPHGNRFAMVNVVRQRSHQITAGAPARVPSRQGENPVSIVMREIWRGRTDVPFDEECEPLP